ncbi:MAG: septum site-determining protein MinC [Clostridiales bacterium]|nr:MAG: septum site-determining protein MinC [Clostridiales bacterium]
MFDIEFKGTKNGIILRYNSQLSFAQFRSKLIVKLKEANHFFEGSHIIGIEGPEFTAEQENEISRLIRDLGGMKVLTLESVNHLTVGAVQPQTAALKAAEKTPPRSEKRFQTIIHRGTLRSGSCINSESDIVLLGDANPGSELSAAGHIVVMGSLRGIAHAGKNGDDSCYVVALKLQPSQIRIGNHITRAPDDVSDEPDYAEIAFVKDGQIIIEPYRK